MVVFVVFMKIVFVYKKNMSMKNLMRLTFIIAIAIFVGYNVYKSRSAMDGLSEMALANVEALALSELDMEKGWSCYDWVFDNVMSETFFIINRCSDCYTVSATNFSGQDYCWH